MNKKDHALPILTSPSQANLGHGFFLLTETDDRTFSCSSMWKVCLRAHS